jgi:amino acid adenylation domain-containing protein
VNGAPLSYPQRSFWLLDQLHPGHTGANEQFVIRLRGPVDVQMLERCWQQLLSRHGSLRTSFIPGPDEPVQVLDRVAPVPMEVVDLSALPVPARESRFLEEAARAIRRPFDLEQDALIRPGLYRMDDQHHALLVTAHHIVADGMSVRLIRDELAALYAVATGDRPAPPALPALEYSEFARRQRAALPSLEGQLEFWRNQLRDLPEQVALPCHRGPRPTGCQRRIVFELPAALADGLRSIAREARATLFMVLLASLRTLLARLAGQADIPIGSPVTCRDSREMLGLVGCLVNNVVFRTSTAADPGFVELLQRERATALAAYQHREIPFERVVEALRPVRRAGQHPLFQVLLLYESDPEPAAVGAGIEFRLETLAGERASYWDLEFSFTDAGPGAPIRAFLGYASELFDDWFLAAIPGQYLQLLREIIADPAKPLSRLSLLDPDTRNRVLRAWNDTAAPYPEDATLHGLVSLRAQKHPDREALVCAGRSLSYAELEQRASVLAGELRARGIRRGDFVGLMLPRSIDLAVAMLATLKAGAAYVPMDTAYPTRRLRFMLEDACVRVVLTAGAKQPALENQAVTAVRMDEIAWSQPVDFDTCVEAAAPDDPAHLLYTSGSTGTPKGAVGLHRGAVNRCTWMWRAFGFNEDDRFSLRTSPNFVDSIWELFGALIHGAAVVVIPENDARDPARLLRQLADNRVSHIVLVPSLLDAMLEEESQLGLRLPQLHTWISSGEPLRSRLLARFRTAAPRARLLNTYGTSEVWDATCFDTGDWPPEPGTVPIGRPIANVRTYVLDEHMQPVPPGVCGMLYVAGVGLGAGYWQRPELNAECFVTDPFADTPGALMYRTGDLVRYRPDGLIEYFGRADHQIKLHGYRIELAEVEAALMSHPAVAQAAADVREDRQRQRRLVAYAVSADDRAPSDSELRQHLGLLLPAHMLPAGITWLEQLPLTPNGKLDRPALPAPAWGSAHRPSARAPSGPMELAIADVFTNLLRVERVGAEDDFFALGGHSLLAIRLVTSLRKKLGLDLSLEQLFADPTVAALAARVQPDPGRSASPALQTTDRDRDLPLSFAQERLWFLDQLDPGSPAYNIAFTISLEGHLDVDLLQSALDALIDRHEALRTTFPASSGTPVARIADAAPVLLRSVDLPPGSPNLDARLSALASEAFDLHSGPLLRAYLVRLSERHHCLLFVIHHIVTDGLSNGILFGDLCALYEARMYGQPPALTPLAFQYADYASWHAKWVQSPALKAQRDYWLARLADAPPALELPTDRPRPADQRFRGAWLWRQLSAGEADRLRAAGREEACTLFMVMLAAFDVLLGRYSGQEDLVVGSPIAGRVLAELDGLVGLFVNTVALRVDLSGSPTFADLLRQVREVTLGAQANQEFPFEKLVEELQPQRTLSRAPVFQAMFNLTPMHDRERDVGHLRLRVERLVDHGVSTFDLTLSVGEHSDGLELLFEYDTDLFDRQTMERFADHYLTLLQTIPAQADTRVAQLSFLTPAERERTLGQWSQPDPAAAAGGLVHELFAAQALAQPNAVAVSSGGRELTYGDLERAANRLARRLRALGVTRDARVAICLDRSPDLLVAILGVLNTGGAYVPLDPDYPAERLGSMLAASDPRVLVSRHGLLPASAAANWPRIDLDGDADALAALPAEPVEVRVTPEQLAYLLFTSGTTGQPKAVMVTHANIASACASWHAAYDLQPSDVHLQMASCAFDVFTGDWVRALCSGGRLVLCPRLDLLEPGRLFALIKHERVTCAEFVPAVIRPLMEYLRRSGDELSDIRLLVVGSDTWFAGEFVELERLCGPNTRLINSYGVAEATIDSTYFERGTSLGSSETVPIGRPFANARVYVCGPELELQPAGVPGELCIGGTGVARGYWRDPTLTAERFLRDPFSHDAGARLYRTGDRARWRADGSLELLGRNDDQLKLRGFRIEPAEIESVLRQHASVVSAVVALRQGPDGDARLVAFIVANDQPVEREDLQRHLGAQLPDYMVPSIYEELPAMPMTRNGKLDRSRLPEPEWRAGSDRRGMAPRTPLEEALCDLFAELLGTGVVEAHDDFFASGGHSLLAARLIARIREALDVELPLKALFEAPTPAGLARALPAFGPSTAPPLTGGSAEPGLAPVSYPQQRLWFLHQLDSDGAAYHLHWAGRLRGDLDLPALQNAIAQLVERHATLRTVFRNEDGVPLQDIRGSIDVPLVLEHLSDETALESRLRQEIDQPFDLATGPLLRILALRAGSEDYILLLVIHHIVADGWSMGVLFSDLAEFYNASRAARPPALSPLPVQYGDYANWQRRWLQGAELERQLRFWTERLEGAPVLLSVPTDRPRGLAFSNRGAWYRHSVSQEISRGLRGLAQAEGCTLFMVLLAAFAVVLGRRAEMTDVVIGAPIAGRSRSQLEGLIGFFVNTLPLRIDLSGRPDRTALLRQVKQTALDAFAHQDLPFEKLVEVLRPAREPGFSPVVQNLFTFHNQPWTPLRMNGIRVEPSVINTDTTKFDLSLHVATEKSAVILAFSYNTHLFDELTIAGLAEEYEALARDWLGSREPAVGSWVHAAAEDRFSRPSSVPRIARRTAASGSGI